MVEPARSLSGERDVLLLDDDTLSSERTGAGLAARGFTPILVETHEAAMATIAAAAPAFAVVELYLSSGYGLTIVERLRALRPSCRIVVVTGYGSIALAVAAIKAGAVDFLPKPVDVDCLAKALNAAEPDDLAPAPATLLSPARVRWEHIRRIYVACGHNVSETARRLKMHRRTLQRLLSRPAPP